MIHGDVNPPKSPSWPYLGPQNRLLGQILASKIEFFAFQADFRSQLRLFVDVSSILGGFWEDFGMENDALLALRLRIPKKLPILQNIEKT